MRSISLSKLNIALIIALLATPALAEEAKDTSPNSGPPVASKEPLRAQKPGKSSPRPPAAWCGVYTKLVYLAGEFSGSTRADRFVRDGLKLGVNCNYNNDSRLTLGVGAEVYAGKFHLTHEEDVLRASISFLETGFKEWVSATLDLHPIKIGAIVGVERTNSNRFSVDSLEVDLGTGYLSFKDFASQHLSSNGELEIWEAGLNVEFPFQRKFSLTFGGLWQRYSVAVRVKLDQEGTRLLEALEYDTAKINRDFNRSRNFFYLTPGARWCGERLCVSLVVPWGVFQSDQWSWGAMLGAELQF